MTVSRRTFLTGLTAGVGGIAVGAVGASALAAPTGESETTTTPEGSLDQERTEQFFGPHQPGIQTPAQMHAVFLAFDLRPQTDRTTAGRMMRLLSDDAARLMAGRPALADTEPELAAPPARLTVTFGFGPGAFAAWELTAQMPAGFVPVPPLAIDDLQERWNGGDLLIQIGCDNPTTLAHARRMLTKDVRAFAVPRWAQMGFLGSPGRSAGGDGSETPRNLMGQVDGTVNPRTAEQFDQVVWNPGPPTWFTGGTMLVVRRIAMALDTWDAVDRVDREQVIGRRLANGAPLTGTEEFDVPDLAATDANGLPVISDFAHIRRAGTGGTAPFLRRGYNYDAGVTAMGVADAGHIFTAYTTNIEQRFVPVQRSLAELDLLNQWTTPIGSAVFALPPGASDGGWVGETLLA